MCAKVGRRTKTETNSIHDMDGRTLSEKLFPNNNKQSHERGKFWPDEEEENLKSIQHRQHRAMGCAHEDECSEYSRLGIVAGAGLADGKPTA